MELTLEKDSLCFTYGQVPVVYKLADTNSLEVHLADGAVVQREHLDLDLVLSKKVFGRTGEVNKIIAQVDKAMLR